jgi:hypothetical protein
VPVSSAGSALVFQYFSVSAFVVCGLRVHSSREAVGNGAGFTGTDEDVGAAVAEELRVPQGEMVVTAEFEQLTVARWQQVEGGGESPNRMLHVTRGNGCVA